MKVNAQPNLVDRRKVLAAGAVGVGAAGLLAACGDDSSADTSSSSSSSSSSDPTTAAPSASSSSSASSETGGASSDALAATSDIPVGSGKIFTDEKVVVTQPTEGDFKAFSAVCTHQGCIVSKVDTSAITCACHQSTFSLKDGSVLGGPASSALPSQGITVAGGSITLS